MMYGLKQKEISTTQGGIPRTIQDRVHDVKIFYFFEIMY